MRFDTASAESGLFYLLFWEEFMTALPCGFNWSTQHLVSNYREEDVENEAADLLYRNRVFGGKKANLKAQLRAILVGAIHHCRFIARPAGLTRLGTIKTQTASDQDHPRTHRTLPAPGYRLLCNLRGSRGITWTGIGSHLQ